MYPAMMRTPGLALLLSIGLVSPALAQNVTPSASPGTGGVGSAVVRNGFPAGGGAVALPNVQNSSGTTATPTAGTTTTSTTSTNSTTSTTGTTAGGSGGAGGSSSGGGGASGGGSSGGAGGARRGGGSSSTAGAATSTGSGGNGTFVLCPPSGAPGLEPLFTGTDLSCAPQ
jgi:hypothetical protein